MYEHQSTYSPNLPVRFLIYLAQEYQMVIEKAEKSLYGTGQISLPTPQCIVFYNGAKEMPEERTLKLSDAFENKKVRAEVLGMLLEEFDAEKYERTIRSEGREEGEVKVNRLGVLLTEAGRSDEFLKSLSDRELQKKLFIEFGLGR